MAYSVITEQELLRLAEPPAENRREQVEQALNEAESRGWVFVGVDRTRGADELYVFKSIDGTLRLGNLR